VSSRAEPSTTPASSERTRRAAVSLEANGVTAARSSRAPSGFEQDVQPFACQPEGRLAVRLGTRLKSRSRPPSPQPCEPSPEQAIDRQTASATLAPTPLAEVLSDAPQ